MTFSGNGNEVFEAAIDIDYYGDYLLDYDVKVTAEDVSGNKVEWKKNVNGVFGGLLDALAAIWDAIAGAFAKAFEMMMAAVSFLIDLIISTIKAAINTVVTPIKNAMRHFIAGLEAIITPEVHSPIPDIRIGLVSAQIISYLLNNPLLLYCIAATFTILGLEIIITAATFGVGKFILDTLISMMISVILSLMVSTLAVGISTAWGGWDSLNTVLSLFSFGLTIAGFILLIHLRLKESLKKVQLVSKVSSDFIGLIFSIIGLIILMADKLLGITLSGYVGLYLDTVGLGLGFYGAMLSYEGKFDKVSAVGKVADAISYISLVVDISTMLSAGYELD